MSFDGVCQLQGVGGLTLLRHALLLSTFFFFFGGTMGHAGS